MATGTESAAKAVQRPQIRITEFDTAADGGEIYEVMTGSRVTYVHHAITGNWIVMNANFVIIDSNLRQPEIEKCKFHEYTQEYE